MISHAKGIKLDAWCRSLAKLLRANALPSIHIQQDVTPTKTTKLKGTHDHNHVHLLSFDVDEHFITS